MTSDVSKSPNRAAEAVRGFLFRLWVTTPIILAAVQLTYFVDWQWNVWGTYFGIMAELHGTEADAAAVRIRTLDAAPVGIGALTTGGGADTRSPQAIPEELTTQLHEAPDVLAQGDGMGNMFLTTSAWCANTSLLLLLSFMVPRQLGLGVFCDGTMSTAILRLVARLSLVWVLICIGSIFWIWHGLALSSDHLRELEPALLGSASRDLLRKYVSVVDYRHSMMLTVGMPITLWCAVLTSVGDWRYSRVAQDS